MPKEEWGVKRVCTTTGKRFYDMNRSPVVSPYTGEIVTVETGTKTRILVADKDDVDAKKEKVDDELLLDDDNVDVETDDEDEADDDAADVLDDDDDDTVSLEEIADVSGDDDES